MDPFFKGLIAILEDPADSDYSFLAVNLHQCLSSLWYPTVSDLLDNIETGSESDGTYSENCTELLEAYDQIHTYLLDKVQISESKARSLFPELFI
jgi:hypothetical protein